MDFTGQSCASGTARILSGIVRILKLRSAGVAGVGVMLGGCIGITQAQQLVQAQDVTREIRYTIQDLGVVGTNPNQPGQPFAISNSGWVSGGAGVGAAEHAVLWRGQKMF